jgi:hypothetical protein
MLTDKDLLLEAYRRGHAWNPAYPSLANLDPVRIALMDGSERDAKDLIASRQASDANMELLVAAFHKGRPPEYDGGIGPATRALAEIPRCPVPDFAPPPGAAIDLGNPDLNRVAESMQAWAAASGSGSWPMPGCDPDRQGVHSIRVRIDPARMPSTISAYHKQALEWVAAYAEIGLAVRYIMAASGDCEIAKRFEGLAGGVIGWNEFPSANTCSQTIDGRLDTGYAPNDGGKLWANLECHETGHGVGLQHTRGHIMNPSILLIWPLSWVGGPSESTLNRYFGGEPMTPPAPPPGPGPTPGQKVFLRNSASGGTEVVAMAEFAVKKNDVLGLFTYVPAPEV